MTTAALPVDFTSQAHRDVLISILNTAVLQYVDTQLTEADYEGYELVTATQQVMRYLDDNLTIEFKD